MLKLKEIKIKKTLKGCLYFIAKRAFSFFLLFLFLELALGGLILYNYLFLPKEEKVELKIRGISLNENLYQGFLESYQARQEKFDQAESKIYWNPFEH
jgi:hypothetical protein